MKNFEYIYPKNIESIPAILSESPDNSLLYAGGMDAMARMKEGIVKPARLINLKSVDDLNYITEDSEGLHIGATTRLADLIENKSVQTFTGLKEAVQSIGTVQLRNMITVAGNLCQKPRCWYFRSRHFPCLRKQGDICYAVNGENKYHCILGGGPCFIIHPSDLAPMLLAMDAVVSVVGVKESRQIKLEKFYVLPEQDPYNETVLTAEEIVTEVFVPKKTVKTHYLKFKERESMDFSLVSVAVAADISGKTLKNIRIVFGGVAPVPWRAKAAENVLEGQEMSSKLVEKAGKEELKAVEPLGQNEFKVILAKNLLKKAVRDLIAS
jgi:xanthine dehydrogenase YagS FAD-binding subunit